MAWHHLILTSKFIMSAFRLLQNYCKQNTCKRPRWMFYICKKGQTKFHKKPKNKTYESSKERNWQIKKIHHWQNKQQTKKFNKLKSMERQVRSHQLVQQNRRKKKSYIHSFWYPGLLPFNLQIYPNQSRRICQNKSIYIIQEGEKIILGNQKWMKKVGKQLDVTMGAYNEGTKIFKHWGLFILYKFQQLNKINNFGLYWNDGLAVVTNMTGPLSEKVKKELQVLFKKVGLKLLNAITHLLII